VHEPPQPLAIMIIVSRARSRSATGRSLWNSARARGLPRRKTRGRQPQLGAANVLASRPAAKPRGCLEQVQQAHDDMEHDRATGKLVVRVRH
jgi:hypothetical protein